MAPVKNLKVVENAFELPLVISAYTEITSLASPLTTYVENTVTTITPMVEVGYNVIKTKVEETFMPHLPEGIAETLQSKMNGAVAHLTVAVEKVDTLACGGVDQLVEKLPALKEATPELIKNTKETLTTYFISATSFLASFSPAQVALKMVDTGLEVVEQVITMAGGSEENTIRIEGNKKVDDAENAKTQLSKNCTTPTVMATPTQQPMVKSTAMYNEEFKQVGAGMMVMGQYNDDYTDEHEGRG